MKDKLLGALALVAAAVMLYLFVTPTYRQGEPGTAGRTAPDFSFEWDGKAARLEDLRGKVVVLNFWATWCPPCVEETPSLNQLQTRIAPLGGTVLGISVDDDSAAYDRFLQQQHIVFPTYRDPSKKIATEYGTFMYPETYILSRDGRIARKIIGPQNWDSPELTAYLQTVLRSK